MCAAMTSTLVVAAAAVAAVVLIGLALLLQRWRLDRRFNRRLSPYERRRVSGGEILDPEEWTRR